MDWPKLLNDTRVRVLLGGNPSDKKPGELRTEFERDFGRTVFSTPVRRLQDKAQVFPLVTDDFVRTRLTHSMEVSSVARGLAGAWVGRWLVKEKAITEESRADLETVAATSAMLHDLGNPPFGHAGEDAISEWCRTKLHDSPIPLESQLARDFLGWNGNAQTIRLTGKLQVLADKFGLNLTCATMSATFKYIASSDQLDKGVHDRSKVGYFFSERELVTKVREATGTGLARHPIALLVEASDDMVYACVDLEDGIKKRLITWPQLKKRLLDLTNECEITKQAIKDAEEKIGDTLSGHAKDEGLAQAFRTNAITVATAGAFDEFKKSYSQIMAGKYHNSLIKQSSTAALIKACKVIGSEVVYKCSEVLKTELTGRRVIEDLLSIFWEAAKPVSDSSDESAFAQKAFLLMSDNYRRVFRDAIDAIDWAAPIASQLNTYYRLQLICDYIGGMTDSFATNLHRKLTNG